MSGGTARRPRVRARSPHDKLTSEQIETILRLRQEGRTISYTAAATGVSEGAVAIHAPGRYGKVPNAPLREAFVASPLTAADVARRLGWWHSDGTADSSRVNRTLGLQHENGPRYRNYRKTVDAEIVEQIAEAIGVSPWSVLPDEDDAKMSA